ncbi:MAG: GNAT family N-acetyltransferase [Acidobacteriota bacterium]
MKAGEQMEWGIQISRISPDEKSLYLWDRFDPATAHPANTSSFARLQERWFSSPVFLQALMKGQKVSQWLLTKVHRRANPFSVQIISACGPQVLLHHQGLADDLFVSYLEFIRTKFRPFRIRLLNYALTRGITETALKRSHFAQIEKFATYVNRIEDDDEILQRFHSSHRNDTRKAMRDGCEFRPSIPLAEYVRLSALTYERSGQHGPTAEELSGIRSELVDQGNGLMSGVYRNGNLEAASVVLFHGHHAYYLHGASAETKVRGATTYLHFENMRILREAGVRFYDFGGARTGEGADDKARSISAFKSRFGGTLVEAYGGVQ